MTELDLDKIIKKHQLDINKIIEQHQRDIKKLVEIFAEHFKEKHERLFNEIGLDAEKIFPLPLKEEPFVELVDDFLSTYNEDLLDRIQIALNIKQEEDEDDQAEYEIEHAEAEYEPKVGTLTIKLHFADQDED